jgi:alkanesulfonate monooxygenase
MRTFSIDDPGVEPTDDGSGEMKETASGEHQCADSFGTGIQVFATTPPSSGSVRESYLAHFTEVARWSEAAGCVGTLVYTDNRLVDPWLVSQAIIASTKRVCPLVAIQPVYMHPYSAAKMVASLGFMYGRRVWLNIVAGGFTNDLTGLGDYTAHDARYERVKEYGQIMLRLLAGEVVTLHGEYYDVKNVRMTPTLPEPLRPGLLLSGSSPAGVAAARAIGAVPVKYPKPPGEEGMGEGNVEFGVRIGIIARETDDEAWHVARDRFPEDRVGQIAHSVAMKVSDSRWHHQLSRRTIATASSNGTAAEPNPYWLGPFQNYKTFCPYLVGSYERIAGLVADYMLLGAKTFILDVPPCADEFLHARVVFRAAAGRSREHATTRGATSTDDPPDRDPRPLQRPNDAAALHALVHERRLAE